MAFGIDRHELTEWKRKAQNHEIAFITHYWIDENNPEYTTVTKVGCENLHLLKEWGSKYGLKPEWIHLREPFPHFDLRGEWQVYILKEEKKYNQLERFFTP
ncbi:hypothetical protein [Salsuginibacillus kocurii]|uniref:hypothetical protein n=1 Tax=Salsuginibacillus kocurii TaxID=427078 RepID=UPI0003661A8D|nr:hypothetical protein [Salsuginibacillus kocurii]